MDQLSHMLLKRYHPQRLEAELKREQLQKSLHERLPVVSKSIIEQVTQGMNLDELAALLNSLA